MSPREYAERALGKAASSEQLDELFRLHPTAHPIVVHERVWIETAKGNVRRPSTTVAIIPDRPGWPDLPRGDILAQGQAICNVDSGDQFSKRRGVEIAFGRALTQLRKEVEGVRHAVAV